MFIAAIDIGGTKIKYGVVDGEGNIFSQGSIDTYPKKGALDILQRTAEVIAKLATAYPLVGIGISATGQVNFHQGIISYATDLIPNWIGTNVREYFEEEFNLPVVVENDVNCIAVAEHWQGSAIGENSFICIALGTGIGGGIFDKGELYRGENYGAGEFGHIKIVQNGRKCRCGDYGCYEAHASTDALVSKAKVLAAREHIDGITIFQYEKDGNALYKDLVEEWIGFVADGLKNIVVSFNPKLMIIGGGVSAQGDYLLHRIEENLHQKLMPSFKKNLTLKMASAGNDSGLLGASYLLLRTLEGK
ncbi:MAG: ROK family protein [Cyanobacteria bacterium P01_F01_bin.153]